MSINPTRCTASKVIDNEKETESSSGIKGMPFVLYPKPRAAQNWEFPNTQKA
jgi:hypothetical protein